MIIKLFAKVFVAAILGLTIQYAQAQVAVDMSAKEVDEIKGTLRVRDLVVNDIARVYGGSLCIANGKFYLPDNVKLSDSPVNEWSVDLKITLLPGRKIKASTVLPKTTNRKRMKDNIESFLSSNLNSGWLSGKSRYCDQREKVDSIGESVSFFELESIDGLNSLRKVYENLKKKAKRNLSE